MKRIAAILNLMCAVCIFIATSNVDAAPRKTTPLSSIVIAPYLQTVEFDASDASKAFRVTLTNNTKQTHAFNVSALDFGSLDETGGLVFSGASADTLIKKYGLARWIQLGVTDVTLEPGATVDVPVSILNDNDLSPGGHYGAILASVVGESDEGANNVSLNQKLTALVMATKRGGERYDMHLKAISHNASWRSLPSQAVLTFENTGNVHIVPRGTVELQTMGDNTISKGIINESSSYILPEHTRTFSVGLPTIRRSVLWPGVYHLRIAYRYDGYEGFIIRVVSIRYFPWISIVLLVLVGIGIAVLWRLITKRFADIKKWCKKIFKKQ